MRLVFLLCVILAGLNNHSYCENYIQFVVQMESKVEKLVQKKYGLNLIATGGQMMYNITSLNLHFEHEGILSKNQMRILLVKIVKLYLNEINNNEKIKPYLNVFPFTPKEVDITIFVEDGYDDVLYPNIAVGKANAGEILFRYLEKNSGPYKQTEEETFEEAEAIVASQN